MFSTAQTLRAFDQRHDASIRNDHLKPLGDGVTIQPEIQRRPLHFTIPNARSVDLRRKHRTSKAGRI